MLAVASKEDFAGQPGEGDCLATPVLDATISYTLADFTHYYRELSGGKQARDAAVWCGVAVAVLLYAAVDACLSRSWGAAVAFVLFTLPFIYGGTLPFVTARRMFNRWNKAARDTTYRLIVSEAGVRVVVANAEGSFNWSYFTVGWEDDEMLVLGTFETAAYLIPRRLLQNAAQESRLHDLLLQQIPAWLDVRTMPSGYLRRWFQKARKKAKKAKRAS